MKQAFPQNYVALWHFPVEFCFLCQVSFAKLWGTSFDQHRIDKPPILWTFVLQVVLVTCVHDGNGHAAGWWWMMLVYLHFILQRFQSEHDDDDDDDDDDDGDDDDDDDGSSHLAWGMELAVLALSGISLAGSTDGSKVSFTISGWLRLEGRWRWTEPPRGRPPLRPPFLPT